MLGPTPQTNIKLRGRWTYLYRAFDKQGKTLDFTLSERRNTAAATLFFATALSSNGIPLRIVIDKFGANGAGVKEAKKILKRFECPTKISNVRSKYQKETIQFGGIRFPSVCGARRKSLPESWVNWRL